MRRKLKREYQRRIAWIVPKNYYWVENRVYKEARSFVSSGYKVKIFAIREKEEFKVYEKEDGVAIERLDFPFLKFLGFPIHKRLLVLPFWTLKLIPKLILYSPDIIHCMNLPSLHIGFLGRMFCNARYVYDSHDLFVDQTKMRRIPMILRRLVMAYEKFLAKRASVVIQTTKSRSKQFKHYYGIEAVTIMNKPLQFSRPKSVPVSLPSYFNCDKKIVGYIGSIKPHRGIEQSVSAVSDMENVVLVLLGPANNPEDKKLLEKIKEKVIWIPPVRPYEIITTLRIFDLGVSLVQNSCLSYYFSCPTKVHELIVAGVPQVASDFPEIRRLVIENSVGPVGRVVDPADVKQIRTAILEMLASPAEMEIYRKNCVKLQSQCIWDNEKVKLISLYRSLERKGVI